MRGHVGQRNGKWFAMARIDGKLTWLGTFQKKADAQRKLTEVFSAIDEGSYVRPTRQTLGEFLDEWFPAVRHSMGEAHWNTCHLYARCYVKPNIGSVKLNQLTHMRLNRLYADLSLRLSASTVHNVHRFLRRALRDAPLAANPAAKASPPRVRRRQFTVWEAAVLRSFLRRASAEGHTDHLAWTLLAMTGIRRGECLRLQWQDIDLDRGLLRVRDSKNGRGRQVSLDTATVALLRSHHQGQGPVFPAADGPAFTKRFQRAIAAWSFPRIRLHDLRHTHATILLQAGVHPKVVQERLGHSSIQVTMDVYSHVIDGMDQDAAAIFGALLANDSLTPVTRESEESLYGMSS